MTSLSTSSGGEPKRHACTLKNPPEKALRVKPDPLVYPSPPLQLFYTAPQGPLHELHPEPRHIYRYWQIFVDSINPLIKIVHVPTLQQRIMDASWDLVNIPRPLKATMFAIYTLAVTSLTADACLTSFGEEKDQLLHRYRTATVHALIEADFLTSRDLEVLQAFMLFLYADPESEITSTLTAAAVRVGKKMGLHREKVDPKITVFEQEMRIRVWWQLNGLNSRSIAVYVPESQPPPPSEFGNIRLPLNVNDADLHPDMAEFPREHDSPTEMIFVLVKLQVYHWLRSSKTAPKMFESIIYAPDRKNITPRMENDAITELEHQYYGRFLRNSDSNIPLHKLAQGLAGLALARLRFKIYGPRLRTTSIEKEVPITPEEGEMLFDAAVRMLDLIEIGTRSKFSAHLFTHLISKSHVAKSQMNAYIYVLSDLRRRAWGEKVASAWNLIGDLYHNHPELLTEVDNTFVHALGDLTLEAWSTRIAELLKDPNVHEADVTPSFIDALREQRQGPHEYAEAGDIPSFPDGSQLLDNFDLTDINDLNWTTWNDFMRL
ncbi:uncharacterized protein E0L32_007072 [Thyridium curvatum]|uniref:Xylanolytic transcriptional activator regulatory domain-containing protein n=1 Tax=Thyridium curvatum TaxID=1093900 RepID=A0A507AZF8_9PEZI|nr:uncharacterized protein E0L32_007072 [Thyridium curvatum]TPX12186.1 hypothetical protein E0L32_007072 [Thyridium curvatum]